ncbi:hypothetical protein B0H21DRAFT_712707 [Amylocystis lapponica]|nr:hypothetical protein B0H21DRAFT_712707 [Amylocystis lapponica]
MTGKSPVSWYHLIGNELAVSKHPDVVYCRQYKHQTKALKWKAVVRICTFVLLYGCQRIVSRQRSSEAMASDALWSMKDHVRVADEKPRHKLRNAISWSAFGDFVVSVCLKDVFITTNSNESNNDHGDHTNEMAQQASTNSAPQQIGRTGHSFPFQVPESGGSSSDGETRIEDHRVVSHGPRSGIFTDVSSTKQRLMITPDIVKLILQMTLVVTSQEKIDVVSERLAAAKQARPSFRAGDDVGA